MRGEIRPLTSLHSVVIGLVQPLILQGNFQSYPCGSVFTCIETRMKPLQVFLGYGKLRAWVNSVSWFSVF